MPAFAEELECRTKFIRFFLESWDCAWNEGPESWDESWSWLAIEDQQPNAGAASSTQGVQSLVLSLLTKFLQVLPQVRCLKQTVQTNLKQFAAIFYVMKPFYMFQLQVCSAWESNTLFCNCENCMIVSD